MKNYIYKRYRRALEEIGTQIHFAKMKQAKDISYADMRLKVLSHCEVKSFSTKLKKEVAAIFDFVYQREISNCFVWPILWEGKLYHKWALMPEDCKKELMSGPSKDLTMRPYPVHSHHFKEGMEANK